MGSRSETKFELYKKFEQVLDEFDIPSSMKIAEHIESFQRSYQQSETDEDIPRRFQYKIIENVKGLYSLYEIYVGPKSSFRAFVIFPKHQIGEHRVGYWVYAFKKQRNNDHPKIKLAKQAAEECWSSIVGKQR